MNNFLKHVPGFKSNNKRNMIIATIYFAICVYMIPQNNFVSAIISFALPFVFFFIKDMTKAKKQAKLNLNIDPNITVEPEITKKLYEPINFSKKTIAIILVCILILLGSGIYSGSVARATEAKAVTAQQQANIAKELQDTKNLEAKQAKDAADKIKADAQAIVDAKVAAAKVISDKKAADIAAAQSATNQAAAAQALKVQYDTGITYDQLARNPDSYVGSKVKLSGKVVQVIEGDSEIDLRVAVGDNYDTILLVAYDPSIVTSRILENDEVTVKGVSQGITTYKSTLGGDISLPAVTADSFN